MLGSLNDSDLAPDSALWREVLPAVRIAIMRGPIPHADFDGWEDHCRKENCLAVESVRWLDDASSNAHAVWSTSPSQLTGDEVELIDDARAALRRRAFDKSGD
ncbi:hypothetical protein [Sphingomonas sp. Leaf10]|uniref:hypothetical protein n=1 Tax=Sphingomonas sp. Leaf10 TaxID=1735676 RepID=UPI0012E0C940|nr:hypothetical protein [Sphingomonas sp. Leaf10]